MKQSLFSQTRRALAAQRWLRMPLLLGAVVALVVGIGAGAAYGYFTSSGNGSGTAITGTAQSVTVDAATGTPSSDLIPGASADLTLTLSNPNSFAVTLTSISEIGSTVTVVGGSRCTSANSGVSVPTQSSLSINVPAGTTIIHIPSGAAMSTSSASGCQGASFQIPVTITVQQG